MCSLCATERVVQDLEKMDIRVWDPTRRGPALCEAAQQGNHETFRTLLSITDDLDHKANFGGTKATALEIAMKLGHVEMVESFLVHCRTTGVIPDTRRALFWAAFNKNEHGMDILLEFGANPSAEHADDDNFMWRSPLYVAVSNGSISTVTKMLSHNPNLSRRENKTGDTLIHGAVRGGCPEILKILLERGVDVNTSDSAGKTPLYEAVGNGHLSILLILLKAKADPNSSYDKKSPLIRAARDAHAHLIGPLISAGADPHFCDSNGLPASCIAASSGNMVVLEAILDCTGPKDHRDLQGLSPLHHAVLGKHERTVEMLLKRTPDDLRHCETSRGHTPLHYAAGYSTESIVRMLLERDRASNLVPDFLGRVPLFFALGKDENLATARLLIRQNHEVMEKMDNWGHTPLTRTCYENRKSQVQVFIDEGADLELPDSRGRTPLNVAVNHGHLGIVLLLLDGGAKVGSGMNLRTAIAYGHREVVIALLSRGDSTQKKNGKGYTALGVAACQGRTDIIALLKEQGNVDIDQVIGDETQLMTAARNGHLEAMETLLEAGADIDKRNSNNVSMLSDAMTSRRTEVAKLLIEKGCQAGSKTAQGSYPLIWAAYHGHTKMVEALVARRVPLDVRTQSGHTALAKAASMGHLEIVRLLVEGGANLENADRRGRTPLTWAESAGHRDVVKFLENWQKEVMVTIWLDSTPRSYY